jgi:hypothetical protein
MPFSLLLHLVASPSFFLSFFEKLSQNARRPVIISRAIFDGEQERSMCLLITSLTDILATSKLRKSQSEFDTQTDRGEQLCLLPSPTDALASSNSEIDNRISFAQRLRRAM